MRSTTKTSLSKEQVIELARRAFPGEPVGSVQELTAGMFNAAFVVDLPGPPGRVVLKVSARPGARLLTYERGILDTEVAVMELLGARTTLPVPRVVRSMPATDLPAHFFMTHLPGTALSKRRRLPRPERESLRGQVGNALGQTHQLRGDRFGYPGWGPTTGSTSWRSAFERMIDDLLCDARTYRVDVPSARIRQTVERATGLLDEVTEPRLVNFDMWPGNVLVERGPTGAQVSGIIDVERAFWGDPLFDFASVDPMHVDSWRNPHLWTAYAEARGGEVSPLGPDTREQARIGLGELYLWTIMAVESYRYPRLYGLVQRSGSLKRLGRILNRLDEGPWG